MKRERTHIIPSLVAPIMAVALCCGCQTPHRGDASTVATKSQSSTQILIAAPENGVPSAFDRDGWPTLPSDSVGIADADHARVFVEPATRRDAGKVNIEAFVLTSGLKLDESKWIEESGYQRWPSNIDDRQARSLISQQGGRRALDSAFPAISTPSLLLDDHQRMIVMLTQGGETAYVAGAGAASEPEIKVTRSGMILDARVALDAANDSLRLEFSPRLRKLKSLLSKRADGTNAGPARFVQMPVHELASFDANLTIRDGQWLLLRTFPITRAGDEVIDSDRTIRIESDHNEVRTYAKPAVYFLIRASSLPRRTVAAAE